jgi:class 3 adenylate cyclase
MEMKAASLIVQTPVLGISAGSPEDAEETLRRFEEEFSLIDENVRALFHAIRTGSVRPGDTERYVGELLALIDRGKERLVRDINRKDRLGLEIAGQAVRAFDRVWIAGAVYPRQAEQRRDIPWYSRGVPDSDGRLRRIAPVLYTGDGEREHIAYAALKRLLNPGHTERNELGLVLRETQGSGDLFVPLDDRGALIFEAPENGFAVLDMNQLLEYEELDRELYRRLQEMRKAGYFDSLEPEKYPVFLYEFAQAAREEFFAQGGAEREGAWIKLRNQYLESLAELFSGPVESSLVSGYEQLIAQKEIDERGRESLRSLRGQLIAAFAETRSGYEALSGLREKLSDRLSASFCVLGPAGPLSSGVSGVRANPTDSEAALLLANSVLSGAAVTPAADIELFFWALASVVIAAFIVRRGGILRSAALGAFLAVLAFSAFSSALIFGGRWIDPLVPCASVFTASLFSALTVLLARNHGRRVIRRAYAPYAPKPALRQVLKTGLPRPGEVQSAKALVLAVRHSGLPSPGAKALVAAESLRAYREEAGALLKKAGAVLAGCDGDLVLAVFGSPLGAPKGVPKGAPKGAPKGVPLGMARRKRNKGPADPLDRALLLALEFLRGPGVNKTWRFGIDTGECAFSYAEIAGYSVLGPPAVSARLLSSLARRYKARVLASCRVKSRLEHMASMPKPPPEFKKLDVMVERESGKEEEFFALLSASG